MKKRIFFILISLMILCCSCSLSKQANDVWAYAEADGTWTEDNRKHYLEVMYLYENLRPNEALTGEQLEASTDEQLLRSIDERYNDAIEEMYMPREDELQYEEMKQLTLSMIEEFNIADRAPDLCFSYFAPSGLKGYSQWITMLIYEDGYDFELSINANDGSFHQWTRYPQGYWTYLQSERPPKTSQELLKERTDEELKNAAETYAKAVLVADTSKIIENMTEVAAESPDVTVFINPDDVYYISIDCNDLSIVSVKRKIYIS